MKQHTDVTVRAKFDDDERDIIRRAAYADGVREMVADGPGEVQTYEAAVGKALQGRTGHPGGNAYDRAELVSLQEAVGTAIESGVPSEEECPAWARLARALEASADHLSAVGTEAATKDEKFSRDHSG
jgi:hypothetical protein